MVRVEAWDFKGRALHGNVIGMSESWEKTQPNVVGIRGYNCGTTGVYTRRYLKLGVSKQWCRLPHCPFYQRIAQGGVN